MGLPTKVPALQLNQGAKAFDENVIFSGASVTLEPGVYYTLTGPNGSGKSTLMSCLLLHQDLTEGQVLIDGAPVTSASEAFRLQVFGLNDALGWLPGLTVGQHLEILAGEGPKIAQKLGMASSQRMSVRQALEELGVPQAYDREPHTLSSGQEQRSRLASLLLRPARYYFLDEPEKRLDTAGVQWIAQWAESTVSAGAAVCIATHDPELNALPGTKNLVFPLDTDGLSLGAENAW